MLGFALRTHTLLQLLLHLPIYILSNMIPRLGIGSKLFFEKQNPTLKTVLSIAILVAVRFLETEFDIW